MYLLNLYKECNREVQKGDGVQNGAKHAVEKYKSALGQTTRYIAGQSEKQAKEQLVSDADSKRPSVDHLHNAKSIFNMR